VGLLQLVLVKFALVLVLLDFVGNRLDQDVLLLVQDVLHLRLVLLL
jgi:hypothetical protein